METHLEPKEWNKLIKNKNTHIIDTRKPFEYKIGTFNKSVNPNVNNFRDFPKHLNKLKKMLVLLSEDRKVVMSHHKTFEHVEKMRNILNESIEIAENE